MEQRVYEVEVGSGEPSMAMVKKLEVILWMIIPAKPVRSQPSFAPLDQGKSQSLLWAECPS